MKKKFESLTDKMLAKKHAESVGLDAVGLDMFSNVAARMGLGTPSVAEGVEYTLERWSNNYWLMITLFRNHWLSRRIVEKPAQDMTKAWPVIQSDSLSPDDIGTFNKIIRNTKTSKNIQTAIKWARLFGGAGALIIIDGHEDILDEPLNLDDVTPGSYKGLINFDRWSGITPTSEIANDINNPTDFNLPEFYEVRGEEGDTFRIHSSRILRFCGPEVPRPENQAQMHWGISELEIAYEDIRKKDNASWAILSLMFRANIIGQRNPELNMLLSGLAAGGAAVQKYNAVLQAQNELLSNQSMLVMGKEGELFSHAYSFGGISDVYAQFQMDVSGAARIPVSILFGRTITGLSQSNDADIRIYEQEIAQKQDEELRPQLDKLYPVICMSEFGEVPDDLDMIFPSIRVLTEEQKSENAQKNTETIIGAYDSGIIGRKTTLQELKSQSESTGIFTNITEEEIENADDEPIMPMEIQQAEARAGTETFESEEAFKNSKNKNVGKDSLPMQEFTVQGLPIVIETKAGNWRHGKDFKVMMPADYGYIKGALGADGDDMDCYIGPDIHSKNVFVVHQSKLDEDGFDEHKCMIGYNNVADAVADYYRGHHRASEIFMQVEPMTIDKFKSWLKPMKTANDSATSLIDWIRNKINLHGNN